MFESGWEFSLFLSKFFTYLAVIGIGGGVFCLRFFSVSTRKSIEQILRYILVSAAIGFHSVIASFFLQVGNINNSGFFAMFDWDMAQFLMELPIGQATLYLLTGFAVAVFGTFLLMRHVTGLTSAPTVWFYQFASIGGGISLFLLAFSFRLTGHISVLPNTAQLGVFIHIVMVSLWIGSLLPLWLLCQQQDVEELQFSLRRFGNIAAAILLLLFASACVMLFYLLESPSQLWTTSYGQGLLVKLLLVAGVAAIAAVNKWVIVPQMMKSASAVRMRQSITKEIVVALAVLLMTAYLTTVIGLNH